MPKRNKAALKEVSLKSVNVDSILAVGPAASERRSKVASFDGIEVEVKERAKVVDLFYYAETKDKIIIAISITAHMTNGALQVVSNIIFGDSFKGSQGLDGYKQTALNMTYLGLGLMTTQVIAVFCADLTKYRQIATWKKGYLKSILRQDVGWYDVNKPQELSSRMGEALVVIEKGLGNTTLMGFQYLAMGLAGLAIAFAYMWDVALVIMALSPVLLSSMVGMVSVQSSSAKATMEAYGEAGGLSSEVLAATKTVASFGAEPPSIERYNRALVPALKAGLRKVWRVGCATSTFNSSMFYVLSVGLLYACLMSSHERVRTRFDFPSYPHPLFGAVALCAPSCDRYNPAAIVTAPSPDAPFAFDCDALAPYLNNVTYEPFWMTCFTAEVFASNDAIFTSLGLTEATFRALVDGSGGTVGCYYKTSTLLTSLFSVLIGMMGLGLISMPVGDLTKATEAAHKTLDIVSRVPTIDAFSEVGKRLESVRGAIEVADVYFSYPTSPHHTICNGYSLSIGAGQTCALCGPSGSGKSTIIQLLERFYDPQSGVVMLDGEDLRTLNLRWLRSQIGLVGQEPTLFIGTVAENIAYGKEGASQEEVEAAAKMANAHDFIMNSLSGGYDTQVGQGGGKLSGGQKQRVAIARAIIKKPAVLLLDEATSALDNESEKVVQAALEEIMAKLKRTTVTIAHRLSTIRNCDVIAVVNKGQIVEKGIYDELVALGGLFHGLATKQLKVAVEVDPRVEAPDDISPAKREASKSRSSLAFSRKSLARHGPSIGREASASLSSPLRAARSPTIGGPELGSEGSSPLTDGSVSVRVAARVAMIARRTSNASMMRRTDLDDLSQTSPTTPMDAVAAGGAPVRAGAFSRLFRMRRRADDALVCAGLFSALVTGGIQALQGWLMMKVIAVPSLISPDDMTHDAVLWALIYLGAGLASNAFGTIEMGTFGTMGEHLTNKLRQATFSTMLHQDMGFFDDDEHTVGALTEFLGEKVALVQSLAGERMQMIVHILALVLLGIASMFVFGDYRVAFAMLGMFPILMFVNYLEMQAMGLSGNEANKGDDDEQAEKKSAGSLVGEVVSGIRTVASFNAEQKFYTAFARSTDAARDDLIRKKKTAAVIQGFSNGIIYPLLGLVILYGGWLINVGAIATPDTAPSVSTALDPCSNAYEDESLLKVFVPVMIIIFVSTTFGQIAGMITDAVKAEDAAAKLFELIDRLSACDPFDESGRKLSSVRGAIEVADVIFAYPTRLDFNICNGYSLSIGAGQTCALCGPSGSGKSTIIQLLERFYDPQSGVVMLDGEDLKGLNVKWLRQQFGLVGQEPTLFTGTVAENIAYGKPGASQEEVEAAAKMANAHDFISHDLELGYKTDVGAKGGKLSGGQKQRVAIARALIRNPPILLFDEATSALDNDSEKVVQAALDELMSKHKRTTVTIAHRLSTIQNCDVIAVVKGGVVMEKGSHDQLVALGGIYNGLVQAQERH